VPSAVLLTSAPDSAVNLSIGHPGVRVIPERYGGGNRYRVDQDVRALAAAPLSVIARRRWGSSAPYQRLETFGLPDIAQTTSAI
jgi:hypothetical protein